MARQPRFFIPEIPQHIIQRGINRDPIFADRQDYLYYLACLKHASEHHGLWIHAFVLMTNHMHMLASPTRKESIPKVMQSLGRRYVQYFNTRYQRTGTLWEGRYRATLIDAEEYLFFCYRYIELNPVRAGMVVHPSNYPWSSYRHNAAGQRNALITDHHKYLELSDSAEERRRCYQALFQEPLSENVLDAIRDATNKAWVLGNDRFKKQIQTLTDRRVDKLPKGRSRHIK